MTSSASLTTISILASFLLSSAFTNVGRCHVPLRVEEIETQRVAFLGSLASRRTERTSSLFMSEAEETEAVEEEQEEAAAEEETSETEEEEELKEDPEITALKEEIASLEKDLKAKRVTLSSVENLADDYTENGYRRKCAEMENMRRMRSQASETSQVSSRANILQSFLPVLETLKNLDESYADNDFAKGYGALARDFENCLKSLDVEEFTVEAGSTMDSARCVAINEEYSDSVKAGVVISVQKNGYEVKGNVIQYAEVVVSLGSEKEAKQDDSAEEAVEEDN